MGLTKIGTDGVKDDAITSGKIPANAVGSSEIADQAVTLDKLPHGTSSNDGKFLRANNGADPSFETVSIPAGTTINNNADNRVITGSGSANTLEGEADLTFDGTNLNIPEGIVHTGDTNTKIRFPAADNISMEVAGSEVFKIVPDAGHGSTQSLRMMVDHTVDGARVNMGGTKAYSAGIIRGMANIRDANAYNVTDNGGGIGFSAIYNNGGSHTTMSQIEGVKANNTDGNYEGAIKLSTRHNLGNMIEKARFGKEGLSFNGDTADANCLNDYEEGTWTPQASGFSISSIPSARYTKIGRIVHLSAYIQAASGSGTSSSVIITNLPFTSRSGSVYSYGAGRIGGSGNAASDVVWQTQTGNNQLKVYIADGGINEAMISGQHMIFSIVYETTS